MPSPTYVARRPGPFTALVQAAQLGGLRLHPLPPVHVRDRFYDTEDGELLRRGLALRVRDQEGTRTAALRPLSSDEVPSGLPEEVVFDDAEPGRLNLPPGPLAEYVRSIVGTDRLRLLLALRQYRTPRVTLARERTVGLLSFDVVVYEVPGAQVVSNEVEIEPMGAENLTALARLAPVLQEHGLEAVADSKFARGIVRLPRTLSQPSLLLPRERRRLEAVEASGPPLLQRRARIVLLDARGFRPDTIAAQTGLSMARVRHWRQRFREVRMGILDVEADAAVQRQPTSPVAPTTVPGPADAFATPPPRLEVGSVPTSHSGTQRSTTPASADSQASHEPPRPAPETPPAESPVEPPAASEPPVAAEPPEISSAQSAPPPAEAPPPAGDGLSVSPPDSHDMAELLEMFAPQETATPLLGEALLDEDDLDFDEDDEPQEPSVREERVSLSHPSAVTHAPAVAPARAPSRSAAYPVILGPFGAAATLSREARGAVRRPVLTGGTALLHAAQGTIAYHVATFETALDRLAAGRTEDNGRRLLIACHRVRLAVESFQMVLPADAAARLVHALRPLAVDLDAALDFGRAAEADPSRSTDFIARRDHALHSALSRMGDGRRREWAARARRLLDRLNAQRDGALDDLPLPSDDYVGEPGERPGPSRLRHVVGSMLWARFEAVRAFENEVRGEVDPQMAYHLAVAISGLHFVLGLAARATEEAVRDLSEQLNEAEHEAATYRHARRTADLVAAAGGTAAAPVDASSLVRVWEGVCGASFRERLAALVASI